MRVIKRICIHYFFGLLAFFLGGCAKSSVKSNFERLNSSTTNIFFENKLEPRKGFGILYYLYYYNGGGVGIGDINNDGLSDIYFTANSKGHNKLYLNKGNFNFEDITDKAGVAGSSDWCTGVTMADVNGDGLLDIYVSAFTNNFGLKGHSELFINEGGNTFVERSLDYGLNFSGFTVQSAFDYDHDGDLDCFILNESLQPNGNIVNAKNRNLFDANAGDYLFRNDVNVTGKFKDVSKEAGIYQSSLGYGLGLGIADLNNDGWEDIYVGNDFHENDYYYANQGNGKFKEEGADHFRHYSRFSMGNDIADYNNDAQLDIITVDMLPPDEETLKTYGSEERSDIYNFKIASNGYQHQVSRNCLQRNNGNGTSFSEVGLISNVSSTDWSWSPLFVDLDNDGWKDLFITSGIVKRPVDLDYVRFVSDLAARINRNNSTEYDEQTLDKMPDGSTHPFIFHNEKNQFKDISEVSGLAELKGFYNGAAYSDLNNDGNVDMVINALNSPALILKNTSTQKNYVGVELKGERKNTKGIGAKAYLFYDGDKMQVQYLMPTRGFQSSTDYRLHFGIDSSRKVDSLLIVWSNQKYQIMRNLEVNKIVEVNESSAQGVFQYNEFFPAANEVLSDVSLQKKNNWVHSENKYEEFNSQHLIPHKESTRGPKLAVADVNKDGLDDFYVCGAAGAPSALMIQSADGKFAPSDTTLFNNFAVCEDVDAAFFDANGDGYSDLWVVAGGNQMPTSPISNADRLFLNDGKGHFTLATNAMPQMFYNKSCIATADVDQDGDTDVFVGVLSDQQKFGIPQSSRLYLNGGEGKFTIAESERIQLNQIGLVTTAKFADLNKDNWPELVVAGEFMPVQIYWNRRGKFEKTQLPASSGLWQTVSIVDIDNDGSLDILGGNWGLNSKLASGKNGPLKLYTADFDGNGSIESILCYTIDGVEYPFLPKDMLEVSLPVLKKAYLTYDEVAGKSVQYMFYDLFKGYTELRAEVLASSLFLNKGSEKFERSDLPFDAQLAPIFSFSEFKQDNKSFVLAGGNFYDVIPYEGRYDAQSLVLLTIQNNQLKYIHQPNLLNIKGQIRDLKWANGKKGGDLIVARNNDDLVYLQLASSAAAKSK